MNSHVHFDQGKLVHCSYVDLLTHLLPSFRLPFKPLPLFNSRTFPVLIPYITTCYIVFTIITIFPNIFLLSMSIFPSLFILILNTSSLYYFSRNNSENVPITLFFRSSLIVSPNPLFPDHCSDPV